MSRQSHRTPLQMAAFLVCLSAALTSCSSQGASTQSSPTSSSSSTAASSGTSSSASDHASASPSSSDAAASVSSSVPEHASQPFDANGRRDVPFLTQVRAAEHESFTRVVLEFSKPTHLAWATTWDQEPLTQGKGDLIPLGKSHYLSFAISGSVTPMTPEEEALYYSGSKRLETSSLVVYENGVFEDNLSVILGMDRQREFRVSTLENPTRLVIDVVK